MRKTLQILGARVHNLKNIDVEIPRDKLTVVTGLSGSGKSSLAFDTIYAEGQRRYLDSLSSFARRFIGQVAKPDVDFVYGLSPVISIEQKTVGSNPRSTVGTMTDIASYLNLLFATLARATSPFDPKMEVPIRTSSQIIDAITALPPGTQIELLAPVFRVYGENWDFVFSDIRKRGCRQIIVDGVRRDLADDFTLPEADPAPQIFAIADQFTIQPGRDKELKTAVMNALALGDQLLSLSIKKCSDPTTAKRVMASFGDPKNHLVFGEIGPDFFQFNNPSAACRTCGGLGTYMTVHPDLLVPDKSRSIEGGAFVKEAFNPNPDNWDGRHLYSMTEHFKFRIDVPFAKLPAKIVDLLLFGSKGETFILKLPPGAKAEKDAKSAGAWLRMIGKPVAWDGIATRIERNYKWYRQKETTHSGMEQWLEKVMVEKRCPDCEGARVRKSRLLFQINGNNLHELGEINFAELLPVLEKIQASGPSKLAVTTILREIKTRLELLLGIGLDYLNFNRRSATLSGGEAQRIRLSTQIGSGLMGMLYVLDEPSIGLHPRDNEKMIGTLRRLRDLGNTVIVVEHDEDTVRAADYVIEMGPGAGVHGGKVVFAGTFDQLARRPPKKGDISHTAEFLSGRAEIAVPSSRRSGNGKNLVVRGARENNLRSVDVSVPLGKMVAVTGASGSGKSSLVNEILFKALWNRLVDSRTLMGAHDSVEGMEHVARVVNIDQAPIGRNSRSNPATYVGFYDDIRNLFAATEESKRREYSAGRFSFNVKGGRCEECSGEGAITTQMFFMADVEGQCPSCKGARFNAETLEIGYEGKTIAEVLDMSIEVAETFFRAHPKIQRQIGVLNELGLGYLTLGQSATTLSGGEAQRIKLASELGKLKRDVHTLYILDEPTTGLHLADIVRLLHSLNRLVDAGHSVVIIEHHLDVIKTADWVIDLGPEGGKHGGEILFAGTPENLARCKRSHTGKYLAARLAQ